MSMYNFRFQEETTFYLILTAINVSAERPLIYYIYSGILITSVKSHMVSTIYRAS